MLNKQKHISSRSWHYEVETFEVRLDKTEL